MSKPIHMADKVNPRGGVSAICFARPRPIDLKRATWTTSARAVTCPKCIDVLDERAALEML